MNETASQYFDETNTTCAASLTDSKLLKITKTTLLTAIMAVAILGNSFVMFIVYKKKNLRRTTNIFIANMAASDLFSAIAVIPRILVELYLGPSRWLLGGVIGEISCRLCSFLADFSTCISIMSHCVISVDRFCAIVYSLRPSPISPARRKYIIGLIWLFSFIINSPNFYCHNLYKVGDIIFCRNDWSPLDSKTSQRTFFTVIFVVEICAPILLMTILYSWLVKSLVCQRSLSAQSLHMKKIRRKEDIRVLRKVLILLGVFLTSLLPIFVFGLIVYYVWDGGLPCWAWKYSFSAYVILLSNSAVNPSLCIALNTSYKQYIQTLLCHVENRDSESLFLASTQRREKKTSS